MAQGQIDLMDLFSQVGKTMKQNKDTLNQADDYNHNHGDHMVEIFDVITQAMKEKKNADPADQLDYAADLLRRKADSGSGQLYAEGFKKAAKRVTGKNVDAGTVMDILQTVLGADKAETRPPVQGDLLTSVLGQLAGGGTSSTGSSGQGLDLGDLLGAGMDFMAARQSGKSDLEALTGALVSGTRMSESPHRAQSSQMVTNTLLKALSSMMNK